MSEKLCLQWNEFQENIKNVFKNLRGNNDFTDVTLACEDGKQVEAHKVILAASSPFFQKILGGNKHPHPLIYLRGVKSDSLLAILNFLYRGEADIFQDNLDSFLSVAEELQLNFSMGGTNEEVPNFGETQQAEPSLNTNANIPKTSFVGCNIETVKSKGNETKTISTNSSEDFDELEEKVSSMMEKSQNKTADGKRFAYLCKICGKEGYSPNIKDHIEANHLEGIIIPCDLCDKTCRSRKRLAFHKMQEHNQKI